MSTKGLKHIGANLPLEAVVAYNRSGAARVQGDVLMFDLLRSAPETTSIENGGEASVFANLVIGTTLGADNGFGFCVLLDENGCDDNARGLWGTYGYMLVRCKDDDAATVLVDAGDNITILNAQHDCDATAANDPKMGLALANAAASGSPGDASLLPCIWWGGRQDGGGLPPST